MHWLVVVEFELTADDRGAAMDVVNQELGGLSRVWNQAMGAGTLTAHGDAGKDIEWLIVDAETALGRNDSRHGGTPMRPKFSIATISQTITDESAARGDYAISEMSEFESADFREALDALRCGCWDNVDWRASEVIAYPADYEQNIRTGAYEADTLVIRTERPEWLNRLATAYDNR